MAMAMAMAMGRDDDGSGSINARRLKKTSNGVFLTCDFVCVLLCRGADDGVLFLKQVMYVVGLWLVIYRL